MRVSFAPYCTNPDGFLSRYNSTRLERAIRIAETFDLWIIVDYHGYSDVFNTTTIANGETVQQCWLNFWSGVTSQFSNGYSQIIWEPENEPAYCPNHAGTNLSQGCFNNNNATAAMSTLNSEYQAFINQTRSQGDSHWIVVQNICSYACSFCPTYNGDCSAAVSGYPTVMDPLDRIFISLHPYMSYQVYQGSWNNATMYIAEYEKIGSNAGVVYLRKYVNQTLNGNAGTVLGSYAVDLVPGQWLKIQAQGSTITVFIDGVQRIRWVFAR